MGKMVVRVGINGFGRIGRLVCKAAILNENVEVVAINDPFMDVDYMVYLFQYDSTHGRFNGEEKKNGDKLQINGKDITVFAERDPANIPWGSAEAHYVVESTGVLQLQKKLELILKVGLKKLSSVLLPPMLQCLLWVLTKIAIPLIWMLFLMLLVPPIALLLWLKLLTITLPLLKA